MWNNRLERVVEFLDLNTRNPRISREIGATALGASILATGAATEFIPATAVGTGIFAVGVGLLGGRGLARLARDLPKPPYFLR